MGFVACSTEEVEEEQTEETTEEEAPEEDAMAGWSAYGAEEMDADNALDVPAFVAQMEGQMEMETKIAAPITEVCQKMGCWIKVALNDTTDMRVYFKDHFTIPIETGTADCVFQGLAYYDTISVDMQQHFLEDAGAPQEEIDMITEPKYELAFEASAILVKDE